MLWDSHAICMYLVEKYANDHPIYPIDLQLRATINQRIFFNAYLLFPITKQIFYPILFENDVIGITDEHRRIVGDAFTMLNRFFDGNNSYLIGNTLTMADLIVVLTVDHLEMVLSADTFPKIRAWIQRLHELPFFSELNEIHSKMFKLLVRKTIDGNRKKLETESNL